MKSPGKKVGDPARPTLPRMGSRSKGHTINIGQADTEKGLWKKSKMEG